MSRYLIALDQGTTSSRCILFDVDGKPIFTRSQEFPNYFPQNGWVEQDPMDIWNSQRQVLQDVWKDAAVDVSEIYGIGITNQRETTIVWERSTGQPIYPAIVWQCRRTANRIDELRQQGLDSLIQKKTGLIADPYFSATKLQWILTHVEGARAKAESGDLLFGTVDTWLMYQLSGGTLHATDYTNASRTMLFNIHTLDWDEELLALFDIPRAMLPTVQDSSGIFGYTDPSVVGFRLPIAGVAGDQQAALFGQGCYHSGDAKNTYGTGCFLLMNTGDHPVTSSHGLLTTIAIGLNGKIQYALEGSVFVAGAAIQWLRDGIQLLDTAAQSEHCAQAVNDSNGVIVVPAFTGLGAPYWDSDARGTILGLTRGTTRNHIIRATLESLAYQTMDVLDAMQKDSGLTLTHLRVDGGACANNFLMQFQSDLLQVPLHRPSIIETTAQGAAYLAGLATGCYSSLEVIPACSKDSFQFHPELPQELRDQFIQRWHRAVEATRYFH